MWQRVLSPNPGEIDPEHEQEVRLVAQARAGAAWALSALVARYQPPVVRYLVRLTGSAPRGQVLAEDVLVRMARRVRGPHGGEHLRLWLLRACTEAGLDALRHPERADPRRLGTGQGPVALIAGRVGESPMGKWMTGWGARRRPAPEAHPPVPSQQLVWQAPTADGAPADAEEGESLTPREALKYRMVRAVLAELPYGDAQCLSLHLVAGLNQSEVAQALGITSAMARRRIVQGLQLFGRRYDAALAGLGLPPDFASQHQPDQSSLSDQPEQLATPAPRTPLPEAAVAALGLPTTAEIVDASAPAYATSASGTDVAETADATERALTSADIMAYLRAAAANAKPHEPAPDVVDAIVEALPPVVSLPSAAPRASEWAGGGPDTGPAQPEVPGASVVATATDEPAETVAGSAAIAPDAANELAEPMAPVEATEVPAEAPSAVPPGSAAKDLVLITGDGAASLGAVEHVSEAPALDLPAPVAIAAVTALVGESEAAEALSGEGGGERQADVFADAAPASGDLVELQVYDEMIVATDLPMDTNDSSDMPVRVPRVVPVLRPPAAPESARSSEPEDIPDLEDSLSLAALAPSAMPARMEAQTAAQTQEDADTAADEGAVLPVRVVPVLAAEPVAAEPVAEPVMVLSAAGADGATDLEVAGAPAESAHGSADGADASADVMTALDDYLLVVEPDAEISASPEDGHAGTTMRAPWARRMHVLSADGEAEDPADGAIWPLP